MPGVKKNVFLIILITGSLFFLSAASPVFSFSKEKVILTTHNLYPYGSYTGERVARKIVADQTFTGMAVDLVRCVFDKMDVPLEIRVYPWKRAQVLASTGEADGFFAASQKDSRDAFAVKSAVIADQKWNWYLLKENSLNPNDPMFKQTATVGGFLGANMLQWMLENGYNVEATPKDTEGLLRMLLIQRVDAVMANNHVMEALIEKYNVKHRIKVFVNQNKPLSVYFRKDFLMSRPGFLEAFNQLVLECKK